MPHTLEEFIEKTTQQDTTSGTFELENPYLLEVRVQNRVWAKLGSMIAYHGDIRFTRAGILEHGISKMLKKKFTGEGMDLMKMEGVGRAYLADSKKKISIIALEDDEIYVNGHDLLALEQSLAWDIKMMRRVSGMMAGGIFNIKLTGSGLVAIGAHGDPLTIRVTPDTPLMTDPSATIAWSGSLKPRIKTDVSLKTFVGRGSGESIQLKFEGNGWVVLQPYEERPPA